MLTKRQIDLIKGTVPVLQEHGVALTSHFYKRMLAGNPELKNVFNQAHQALGAQQKALAAAVLAYAANIENPAVLTKALKHIAAKHVTIGIRPEQYAIVGKHLLASIKEVLGDAATPELIDAWAAAYGQLADLLIKEEGDLYQTQADAEGGWSGWRPFKVERRGEASKDAVSFYLIPADGGKLPSYLPGQYISVNTYLADKGVTQPRQYSLSDISNGEYFRITVKRIAAEGSAPAGAVSNWLADNLKVGDMIEVSAPAGVFYLEPSGKPLALISAGIGITPMISMIKSVQKETPEREVAFIYCTTDHDHFPLREDVKATTDALKNAKRFVFQTQADPSCGCCRTGRLTPEALAGLNLNKDSIVYLCGPADFMKDVRAALIAQGFDASAIHAEVFGTGDFA